MRGLIVPVARRQQGLLAARAALMLRRNAVRQAPELTGKLTTPLQGHDTGMRVGWGLGFGPRGGVRKPASEGGV